ncbi:hypothetical protein Tco_0765260 [Tanacetum coccineum]
MYHPPPANNSYHKTYANILTARTIPTRSTPPKPTVIHSCPDLSAALSHSLVGEVSSVETFPNIKTICIEAGFTNVRIKYIGGLHIIMIPDIDTPLQSLISNPTICNCFRTLKPWNANFLLRDRLAWISIEGLPPQAWHEAAFTHIAGNFGEVIFPEKCNILDNNLTAGKVCVRTKCMDFILCNMPVTIDDVHVCVRICEILGECDKVFMPEKHMVSESDTEDDCSSNNDYALRDNQEDGDDLFDDGSECNFTVKDFEGDDELLVNGSSPSCTAEISKYPAASESQRANSGSPIYESCEKEIPTCVIPETQFEVRSPSTKETLEKDCPDIDNANKKEVDKDLASRWHKPPKLQEEKLQSISRNQLLNIAPSNYIDDEVLITMEVGCDLGFDMAGKEQLVRKTIGVNIVDP